MRTIEAMKAVLEFAKEREYDLVEFDEIGVNYEHLLAMVVQAEEGTVLGAFTEAKISRWLGYMQGVLVANGVATLEEMKELSRNFEG